MPADTLQVVSPAAPPADRPPREKLLVDVAELAELTGFGVRTLRRMDAAGEIPGHVTAPGCRRVLFHLETIREWARLGLPGRQHWPAAWRRSGKR